MQQSFSTCVYCMQLLITLVGSIQCNYFENATTCSKRTLKTTVATQLKEIKSELKQLMCRFLDTLSLTGLNIFFEWSQIFYFRFVTFINVKRTNFSYERRFSSYVLALSKNLYKTFARLTLMKLTALFKNLKINKTRFNCQ